MKSPSNSPSHLSKPKQKFSITSTISNLDNLLTDLNELTKKADKILWVMITNDALVDFWYDEIENRYVHKREEMTGPQDYLWWVTITGTVKNKSGKITWVEVKWIECWYDSEKHYNQTFVIPYEYFTAKNDTILEEMVKKDIDEKIKQVKQYQASRKVQNESWYSLKWAKGI